MTYQLNIPAYQHSPGAVNKETKKSLGPNHTTLLLISVTGVYFRQSQDRGKERGEGEGGREMGGC